MKPPASKIFSAATTNSAFISLKNLSVSYPIYDAGNRSLRNALLRSVGGSISSDHGSVEVKALSNLNFDLREGARLGVIGHNGAGKSTLLKVMSRIYHPTAGSIEIKGTISSLVDIMMGLDIDATGYENILIRGTLVGWHPSEITALADEIASFTELSEFLHLPIRTYSTGMMVRLAFAISTAKMPDILIMDEMVGAADSAFTAKARDRIAGFIETSRIVVFASHDFSMLERFCNRAILLKNGTIVADGPVAEIVKHYRGTRAVT